MSRPILFEVIATDVADARAAVAGGADRLELVSDMAADGLSPDPAVLAAIREAVDVPLRVMVRTANTFAADDLDGLCRTARTLRAAGADEFVLGFLTADGRVDMPAMRALTEAIDGCAWTFHRAVDRAADRAGARAELAGLPGLDTFLTAGSPQGVPDGIGTLVDEAARGTAGERGYGARLMVGGGLKLGHLPELRAAGVDAFHVGTAVREGETWSGPLLPARVQSWTHAIRGEPPE